MHSICRITFSAVFLLTICSLQAQETRLLRQPSMSATHIAFSHGGDIWICNVNGSGVKRITSTAAVESNPIISPDGQTIAFSSNRAGTRAVYTVSVTGGTPKRITWHPSGASVRGWTPDGSKIIYASSRDYAPKPSNRLWVISKEGGVANLLSAQRGYDGSLSPDGNKVVLDVVSRWEDEFRDYRGGQNTPLVILDLKDQSEILIPNDKTIDIQPVWIGENIYFLSDRTAGTSNIWSYKVDDARLTELTNFTGADIKWLSGNNTDLIFEREGRLHIMNIQSGAISTLMINVVGDFPWAEPKWENVTDDIQYLSLSNKGKRVVMEARGEIFTVPTEFGDIRNLTNSAAAADRKPMWSPKGDQIAWFSDEGHSNYVLKRISQDGMETYPDISIGISKYAWEPTWSPDAAYLAFVDDDLRVRVITLASGDIKTIGTGGINIERGNMGLSWSPDSKWLAYTKSGANNFKRIHVYSIEDESTTPITNAFAHVSSPSWDRDGKHLYFLATTNLALRSGWANTSSMNARPEYAAYVINLDAADSSPFKLRSDEEEVEEEEEESEAESKEAEKDNKEKDKTEDSEDEGSDEKEEDNLIKIDFENIDRRIIPLPIPNRNYVFLEAGPKGSVFIAERIPNQSGLSIHKFKLEDREPKDFITNVRRIVFSGDGEKVLTQVNGQWKLSSTKGDKANGETVKVALEMKLDRSAEWKQMFEEAWRYEKDYFYDPDMHGRDWDVVYKRYSPLIEHVKHRSDFSYVLDQMNGEMSVGHSFVFGGDFPEVEKNNIGLLGADFIADNNRWKIQRIYTTENWNPNLTSPLDEPGLKVTEGNYLVGINGKELNASDNIFERLDGTLNKQTVLHINDKAAFEDAWTIIVKPIRNETNLRQRAWVEDNRKLVDSLSDGKLAYVWVPNTSSQGLISFNRYYFAQQDKLGAVIDERYNGGGLLDDYMVDLMTRKMRAAYTNEVPDAKHRLLPAGILGPKVLLINEMSGSGGDFFPWVFRQQNAGPLIGTTTWGGLVKSSVHYRLVDGGALTAPDNAIFDPVNNTWIAENTGVAPDIEVRMDARAIEAGRDPQIERAVEELLKVIEEDLLKFDRPSFSKPAKH